MATPPTSLSSAYTPKIHVTHPNIPDLGSQRQLVDNSSSSPPYHGQDNPAFTFDKDALFHRAPSSVDPITAPPQAESPALRALPPLRRGSYSPFLPATDKDSLTVPAFSVRRQSLSSSWERENGGGGGGGMSLPPSHNRQSRPSHRLSIDIVTSDLRAQAVPSPGVLSARSLWSSSDFMGTPAPPDLDARSNFCTSSMSGSLGERMHELVRAFSSRTQRCKELISQPPTPSSTSSDDDKSAVSGGEEGPAHRTHRLGSFIPTVSTTSDVTPDPTAPRYVRLGSCRLPLPRCCLRLSRLTDTMESYSKVYVTWLFVVMLAFTYNSTVIPLRGVFPYQTASNWRYWLLCDYLADLLYLADILLFKSRLRFTHDGVVETEFKQTKRHYTKKWVFKFDVLSLLPLDILYLTTDEPWLRKYVWLRLPRMLKIQTFWEFYARCDQAAKSSAHAIRSAGVLTTKPAVQVSSRPNQQCRCPHDQTSSAGVLTTKPAVQVSSRPNQQCRIVKTMTYIEPAVTIVKTMTYIEPAMTSWLTMCATWRVAGSIVKTMTYIEPGNDVMLTMCATWRVAGSIVKTCYSVRVLDCGYRATSFGSTRPEAHKRWIRDIVEAASQVKTSYRKRMDDVLHYMQSIQISDYTQDRTRQWFLYNWEQSKTIDERSLVAALPKKLQTDLAISVHFNTLIKVQLFQDCERNLLYDLVLKLKPNLFLPGDFVCQKGEVGKEMYIVSQGQVEVVGKENMVLATLSEGSVFGEISLLAMSGRGNRRTADVRSSGFTSVFTLSKNDFEEAMNEYPEVQKLLKKRAKKLLKENARKMEKTTAKVEAEEIIKSPNETPKMVRTVMQVMKPESQTAQKLRAGSSLRQHPSTSTAGARDPHPHHHHLHLQQQQQQRHLTVPGTVPRTLPRTSAFRAQDFGHSNLALDLSDEHVQTKPSIITQSYDDSDLLDNDDDDELLVIERTEQSLPQTKDGDDDDDDDDDIDLQDILNDDGDDDSDDSLGGGQFMAADPSFVEDDSSFEQEFFNSVMAELRAQDVIGSQYHDTAWGPHTAGNLVSPPEGEGETRGDSFPPSKDDCATPQNDAVTAVTPPENDNVMEGNVTPTLEENHSMRGDAIIPPHDSSNATQDVTITTPPQDNAAPQNSATTTRRKRWVHQDPSNS
ncbi:uncharacterized protein LOC143285924 [Babylonia areolata]|uniref:uncharacterized protein LOC143285924 n=1 Tax=Babylonia areolata TaxID=304850 RepID=UPI003FD5F3DC